MMATILFVESNRPGIAALESAKRLGHRVLFMTSGKFAWLYGPRDLEAIERHCARVIHVEDTQDAACLVQALRETAIRENIDAVATVMQLCVEPVALAAKSCGLRSTSPDGVANARNKGRCRDILSHKGIPSLRHRVVGNYNDAADAILDIGFPCIVKPLNGTAKLLTAIVHNDDELRRHFAAMPQARAALQDGSREEVQGDFIMEELGVGPLFSVELGATAYGEWIPFAVVQRKIGRDNSVLELGSTIPCALDDGQQRLLSGYAIDVAKALGLDLGLFHIEIIQTDKGPRLVEVNPRLAGGSIGSLIKTTTGENIFDYFVRIHLGERIGVERLEVQTAASHTFIGFVRDCEAPADLPSSWFSEIAPRLSAGHVDITPGQKLRKMSGNLDIYGFIQVQADNHEAALRKACDVQDDIARRLGAPLVAPA